MNKFIGLGRLTKDPETKYTQGEKPMAISRYTLAVNRKFKKDGQPAADFLNCVAFGKNGEFAERYLKKGMQIAVTGSIQTNSYTDKDGNKRYTTDVVVDEHEFTEKKQDGPVVAEAPRSESSGFVDIDGFGDGLPF